MKLFTRFTCVLLASCMVSACAGPATNARQAAASPGAVERVQPTVPPETDLLEANLLSAYDVLAGDKKPARAANARRRDKPIDIDAIPAFKQAFGEADVAVVIGVENYRTLPPVDFASNDAHLIKKYLLALGFSERNIRLITDDGATFSAIKVAIENWLPNVTKAESRIFFFYSGHGSPEPTSGSAYLIPHDGDPNYLAQTSYPIDRLYSNLSALPAKEIIILLDACFSGTGDRSVLAKGTRAITMRPKKAELPSHLIVLAAAEDTQTATTYEEMEHGLFTYFFLKSLQGGKKSLGEIYKEIRPKIADEARRKNVTQLPTIQGRDESVRQSQLAY